MYNYLSFPTIKSNKLKCLIFLVLIAAIIDSGQVNSQTIENISDHEKDELLEWVNSHCEKGFESFTALVEDRRIKCTISDGTIVPTNYHRLHGGRHVGTEIPMKYKVEIWFAVIFVFVILLSVLSTLTSIGRRTSPLVYFTRPVLSIYLLSPWLLCFFIGACLYSMTIYQDEFLDGNVEFIKYHGKGKFNEFLINLCSNNLFFDGNPNVYAAVDSGSLDLVKFLVEDMKMNPNKDYYGVLPIALAANHRMYDIVDYLYEFIPKTVQNNLDLLPFKTAILLNEPDVVKKMLKNDFVKNNINLQSPGVPWISRRSALYLAISHNNNEIARLLLESGADPYLPNSYDGISPVKAAIINNNTNMSKLLKEYTDKDKA